MIGADRKLPDGYHQTDRSRAASFASDNLNSRSAKANCARTARKFACKTNHYACLWNC